MQLVGTTLDKALEEFPKLEEWIENIRTNFISKEEFEENDIQVMYLYGFFVPKMKDDEQRVDYYTEKFSDYTRMLYKERLEEEFKKLRVEICIQIGKFSMVTRIGYVPEDVEVIVNELTKIKMMVESEEHNNKEVIESIPPVDKSIVSYYFVDENNKDVEINDAIVSEHYENPKLDMDVILDKISRDGIESLTEEEKEYLDKKSKNL
jgi:hypothetical protein